jgi:transposase
MQPKTMIQYSVAFKQQVVADLENGRFRSILAASEHYGIGGAKTVRLWLKRFGKNHLIPKVVRVEKPDEADQVRQLKKQIRQLQEVLGKTQMKSVMNESFLEIACEQLGVDVEEFKKKVPTKGSTDRGSGPGCR